MGKFRDKKIYVLNRENYGHQKINLIVHVKINEKSWILRTVYVKHLLFFFWFFKIFGSDQLATFFVSSDLPWHMVENSCRLFNTSVHICFLLIIHIYALLKHILSMIMQIFAHTHYHTRDLLLIRSNLIWKTNLICSSFKRLKFVYIVLIS